MGICFIGLLFTCLEGDEGIECDVDEEESSDIWDNAINDKKKRFIKFWFKLTFTKRLDKKVKRIDFRQWEK